MNNKIILKDGKELIGISNIVISEVDDSIYINNVSQVEVSIEGSLAFYSKDGVPSLIGSGVDCVWNKDDSVLEVLNVNSNRITSKTLSSEYVEFLNLTTDNIIAKSIDTEFNSSKTINSKFIKVESTEIGKLFVSDIKTESVNVSNYAEVKKLAIDKWFGFISHTTEGTHPFKIALEVNPYTNKDALIFKSNDYGTGKNSTRLIALEDQRVSLKGITNLSSRTIESSIGLPIDQKGDIAIDENFLYYCVKDYDGTSSIWKRCPLMGW